jgi:hypothetical protein
MAYRPSTRKRSPPLIAIHKKEFGTVRSENTEKASELRKRQLQGRI